MKEEGGALIVVTSLTRPGKWTVYSPQMQTFDTQIQPLFLGPCFIHMQIQALIFRFHTQTESIT